MKAENPNPEHPPERDAGVEWSGFHLSWRRSPGTRHSRGWAGWRWKNRHQALTVPPEPALMFEGCIYI